jgi:hypothetical protein
VCSNTTGTNLSIETSNIVLNTTYNPGADNIATRQIWDDIYNNINITNPIYWTANAYEINYRYIISLKDDTDPWYILNSNLTINLSTDERIFLPFLITITSLASDTFTSQPTEENIQDAIDQIFSSETIVWNEISMVLDDEGAGSDCTATIKAKTDGTSRYRDGSDEGLIIHYVY